METYLDRIKKLKNEKKMTNDRLAERSGIPLGTLSKLLAGMNDSPKLSNLVAICQALGCSVEYIVSGTPENHNNYLLNEAESRVIEQYRRLDTWGRSLAETVIEKELERIGVTDEVAEQAPVAVHQRSAKILSAPTPAAYTVGTSAALGKRQISLYDLPVSAGVGVMLDGDSTDEIVVSDNSRTREADYALRISGNSMEPRYRDGDILLVQETDTLEFGELGIFILDGNGFFKVFGGDRLYSLNDEYGDILLKDFEDVRITGRVIGKLKKR
jgi:repressor LexA